jgi:hypothetical protein
MMLTLAKTLILVIWFSTTLSIVHPLLYYAFLFLSMLIIMVYFANLRLEVFSDYFTFTTVSLFTCYVLILTIAAGLLSVNDKIIPVIGSLNILLFLLVYFILFNKIKSKRDYIFESLVKYMLILGVIIALGAVVQHFFSPSLWGLIEHHIYTHEIVNININKRAVSFISSPQSLGLFLSIMTILTLINKVKFSLQWIFLLSLFIFAGYLTETKIYVMTVSLYMALVLTYKYKVLGIVVVIILLGASILIDFPNTQRAFQYLTIITSLEDYATFIIWKNFVLFDSTLLQILFGHGVGALSRGSQSIGGYSILNGSTESFIIQLYFELGVIGLVLYLTLYIRSVLNFSKSYKYKEYAILLLTMFFPMLFVPSFYGFTSSIILNMFLVFGLFLRSNIKTFNSNLHS